MPTGLTLVQEWNGSDPSTPDEIAEFYATSTGVVEDLEQWHTDERRQTITEIVVNVVQMEQIEAIVDIGCGPGYDLTALHEMYPDMRLYGVEPNDIARARAAQIPGATVVPSFSELPADAFTGRVLFSLIDVLEHIPNPRAFLATILDAMPVGSFMIERTPTYDIANPTHLKENWGWRPNSQIIQAGCWPRDTTLPFYVNVWERKATFNPQTASVVLCCYKNVQVGAFHSMTKLISGFPNVGIRVHGDDALVQRVRSKAISDWYRETGDDVFLMVDDDIIFRPEDAIRVIEQCRQTRGVVGGAYAVRSGAHLSSRISADQPGNEGIGICFGVDGPLVEADYVATGFMAVHRDVIDALVPEMEILHPHMDFGFWLFFPTMVVEHPLGFKELLSEDWAFCKMAADKGFSLHIDPAVRLGHIGSKEYTVDDLPNAVVGSAPL